MFFVIAKQLVNSQDTWAISGPFEAKTVEQAAIAAARPSTCRGVQILTSDEIDTMLETQMEDSRTHPNRRLR